MKGRVICKQARKKTIWRGWPHSEIEASKSQRHGLVFFVASIIVIIYSNKSISIRLYMKSWVFTVYYTVHFIIYILKFIIFPFKANSEVGCVFFTFYRFHGRKPYELSYFRHRNMSTLKYIVLVKSKVFEIQAQLHIEIFLSCQISSNIIKEIACLLWKWNPLIYILRCIPNSVIQ